MKAVRPGLGWWLCGAAFVLRAAWVLYRWQTHGAALAYPDEELHWQLANNLIHHGALVTDDGRFAARMPLYPLFLTLFAGLGSAGVLAARLAQAVLGAATAGLAYRVARKACGPRGAALAGLLVCCDPFGIFFANLLLTEVLFTLLAIGLTVCAWEWLAEGGTSRALGGVALLGPALVLTRPSALGWVLLLWALLGYLAWRQRAARQRPFALLVCPVALVVPLLPWGVRNKVVLDSFALLSTNGGVTLYDAQGPQADGSGDQSFLNELPELRGLDEVALDRTLTRLALAQMRANPGRALRLAGVKFLRTWSLTPNVAEYRSGTAAYAGAAYTAVVLFGGVLGLLRGATAPRFGTSARAWPALIWLPVVYFTLVHGVYVGSVRYRVPLMPFVALAAAGYDRPINRNRGHEPELGDENFQ